tara:strand:+ start:275 stop:574 length:300 start_codon:yes stop_codon:yes gene_type:complete
MERIFDKASLIRLLKAGLDKPNPDNPKRMMWTLEDLDKPSSGWIEVVNNCEGNPAFPQGYQGVKYQNLARLDTPRLIEERWNSQIPRIYLPKMKTYFFN